MKNITHFTKNQLSTFQSVPFNNNFLFQIMDRLKSVPYKLWRRRSGNSQISDQNPPTLSSPTEDDDIFEEERSPLELATEENAHLQATVIKLTQDLESLQNSHLSLESKVDDLDQKLQLGM